MPRELTGPIGKGIVRTQIESHRIVRWGIHVDLKEALKHNYLFRGLSDSQLEQMFALAKERAFTGGDVIMRQFDKNNDLMIVLSGTARIKTFSGETLAEVGSGSVIGEISLIDDQPRSATVVSVGPSSLAVIGAGPLAELLEQDVALKSQFLLNIGKLLCQRLRTANIQLDAALA